ncbi:AI-2E family transporter [Ramlibacter ginsenosidimutans]|uniref:AI-2E family transporter n=1 Tax=Ramlibacter ginsenosidimutans TaxID=502333 RepID=A0A934TQQ3_9BURK|nr:AI-2E family transporter [Ramlibacter ginsenosidimutans]MBK6005604.1 AI-2E family transporter [Ramlibacter ginsenosidimutans]
MDDLTRLVPEREPQAPRSLLEVLIRAALILVMAVLCYQVFAPFLVLMEWALILSVTLYPLHQRLARHMGGRQGWAATLIALLGILVIVVPAAVLVNSMGDSVHRIISDVQQNKLEIPPPRARIAEVPIIGPRIHAAWQAAYDDLPSFVQSLQPKIGNLARATIAMVAAIGGDILKFVAAYIIAGIVMAFGSGGATASRAIFARVFGPERGMELARLSVATIRAVAQGVIGIAFVQALAVGLALLVARVPLAGVLAGVVLVLGIAQVPALIVTLPAIGYIWWSGDYSTGAATGYTVLLVLVGMVDNVLKPLLLGRGVDVPMPVILIGALGGMATAGILGLFVGATLLALGYKVFMGWVHEAAEPDLALPVVEEPPAAS